MSVALDAVDLSAVAVGSVSPTPLSWAAEAGTTSPMAVRSGTAHLRLFNESGAGLKITFSNGASDRVPAGGWPTYELKSGQTSLSWVVEYLLPGAPVSQLLAVFYEPGEAVPDAPVLGNSPIGIGGSVTTSTTSALKQDGQGPATSLVEATPSDQAASSVALNNDASGNISVLSAGSLRDILRSVRGNAATGHATVSIGDTNDTGMLTLFGQIAAALVQAGALGAGVGVGQAPATTGYPGPRLAIAARGTTETHLEGDGGIRVVGKGGFALLGVNLYHASDGRDHHVTAAASSVFYIDANGQLNVQHSTDAPTVDGLVTYGQTAVVPAAVFSTTQPAAGTFPVNTLWINTGL